MSRRSSFIPVPSSMEKESDVSRWYFSPSMSNSSEDKAKLLLPASAIKLAYTRNELLYISTRYLEFRRVTLFVQEC